MLTGRQSRTKAAELRRLAARAENVSIRDDLISMADAWLAVAATADWQDQGGLARRHHIR